MLNTTTFELVDTSDPAFQASPKYAILSHRWAAQESTFQDYDPATIRAPDAKTRCYSPQAWKIRGACAQARADNLNWLWIDTCCINKESSAELSEAINSMFRWYRNSFVCYVYLNDVTVNTGFRVCDRSGTRRGSAYSEWFYRGWTLQELLAPEVLAFFDRDWRCIGSRSALADSIEDITGIGAEYLDGSKNMKDACIAVKMSWMAGRKTTRIEDRAYSLLGVFDINLTPVYGEREKSFLRLQRALLEQCTDESLFAWRASKNAIAMPRAMDMRECQDGDWGLLAPSPDYFRSCGDLTIKGRGKRSRRADGGFSWTQQGIRLNVPTEDCWAEDDKRTSSFGAFMDGLLGSSTDHIMLRFTLNCWRQDSQGQLQAIQIYLHRPHAESGIWTRYRLTKFGYTKYKVPDSGSGLLRFEIGGQSATSLDWVPIVVHQPSLNDRDYA